VTAVVRFCGSCALRGRALRAWAGGGREPPRRLLAIFDGKRLVLEPLEEGVAEG
jgi:hypothetical protein